MGVSEVFPMSSLTFCFCDKHIFLRSCEECSALCICESVNARAREVSASRMFLCTPLYIKRLSGWKS